jgi:predicted enzyme related to lactoylglutathione lyase
MTEPRTDRWSIAPYFLVPDVTASATYYRDVLGFTYDRIWGEPPSFAMVWRRGVVIMLAEVEDTSLVRPNNLTSPAGRLWDAYVWVPDADLLHAEFQAKGASVAREPCDQEYGCRDFEVVDCNGYRLCFGQIIR